MNQECVCTVSKSGPQLFARIPNKYKEAISRGDKVKIIVLEKAILKNEQKVRLELEKVFDNPNGEKLKGNIAGYPVNIPLAKLINKLPKEKLKKLFYEAIMED